MSQQYPETEESEEAAAGTASHEIAPLFIDSAARGNHNRPKRENIVGTPASNGVIITDEMFDCAEIYANDVISVMRDSAVFGGPNIGIEHRIEAKRVHDMSFGTTDAFIFDRNNYRLYIWDYKFGYELVEAFENWQSINYLAGLVDMLDIDGYDDQRITVHIRIAQPRAFHRDGMIREWTVKLSDLRGRFNILSANAHKALSNDAEIHTGDHCRHCQARHACPAALQVGLRLFEITGRPVPMELSPQAIGVQLAIIKRALKQLEYLESGFEEQVKSLVRSGVDVPGWMVQMGVGREKWSKPIPEVLAMGEMLDQDLKKPDEAITPNQARKLGIDDAVIKAYSDKPRTGLKIVPDNGNKAKKAFTS